MKLALIAVTCTLVFTAGCSAERTVAPQKGAPTFPAEYWFINTGDGEIDAVEITGNTYYPDRDYTNLRMQNWQSPAPDARLMLEATYDAYAGCQVQVMIAVHKIWDGEDHGRWRFWVTEKNVVETAGDAVVEFVWPDDTAKAREVDRGVF